MEAGSLKSLAAICEPDLRQKIFSVIDERSSRPRPKTLEDHYSRIEPLRLNSRVPDNICNHFDIARNLLLYSWFAFDFIQPAELYASTSVEYALKERIAKDIRPDESLPKGLKALLKYASAKGWIRDEGFTHFRQIQKWRKDNRERYEQMYLNQLQLPQSDNDPSYAEFLLESLPWLRNEYAHGSEMRSVGGYLTLELCRDLIDQLFA